MPINLIINTQVNGAGLTQATKGVQGFGTESEKAASSVGVFAASAERLGRIGQLSDKLQLQNRELGILQQELGKTSEKYGESATQTARKQLAVEKLQAAISTTTKSIDGEAQSLAQEQQAAQQAAKGLVDAAVAEEHTGQAAGQATPAVQKLGNETAESGTKAEGAGKGFSAFAEMAKGALREVGAMATQAIGQATQALGAFVADSVNKAGDFESGMNDFKVAVGDGLGASGKSIDDFKGLFLSLGRELPVSTAEVQQAAITLVKGGIDPAVVAAGGLKDSLQFAAAAGMDLNAAAELSIKTLGTFAPVGASAAEQTKFLADAQNLLVKVAGASTLDVDKLGDAMLGAAGQAKAAGVDYNDFVTTMGLISPAFGSAAEAGTSYKNFLARLQPSTTPAKDAMAELGLMTTSTSKLMKFLGEQGIKPLGTDLDTLGNQFTEFAASQGMTAKQTTKLWESFSQSKFYDESTGAFIGNKAAAELLQKSLAGLSDAERSKALETIFGNDAAGAAIALAQQGAEGYDLFAGKVKTASDVQAAAAAKQQGFNTALDNMKGSVEALQITVGGYLLPVLTDLFNNVLSPAINIVGTFTDAVMGNDAAFGQLSPELQTVATVVGQVMTALGDAAASFGTDGLGGALATLGADISEFSPAAGQLISALAPVGDMLQANLVPILVGLAAVIGVAVVGAIASFVISIAAVVGPILAAVAVVGVMYAAYESNFAGIKTVVDSVMQAVGSVVSAVMGAVNGTTDSELSSVRSTFTTVWNAVQSLVSTVLAAINKVVTAVLSIVATFIKNHGDDIRQFLTTTWNTIGSIIKVAVELVSTVISTVFGAIATFLHDHGATIQALLSNTWEAIKAVINAALAIIKGVVTAALALIKGDWEGAWNAIKEAASTVWESIKTIIGVALDNARLVITDALGAIKSKFEEIFPGLKGIVEAATSGVLRVITSAWDSIKSKTNEAFGGLGDTIKNAFGGAVSGIKEKLNEIIDSINKAIEGFNKLSDAVGGPHIGKIPKLAGGTRFFEGGLALVGERGPELVSMPRGSQVTPASETARQLGGTTTNNYYLTANYGYESEASLGNTVRMLQMLTGGA